MSCFLAVARHFGDWVTATEVRHTRDAAGRALNGFDILLAAHDIKIQGTKKPIPVRQLRQASGPCIMVLRDGEFGLFEGYDKTTRTYLVRIPVDDALRAYQLAAGAFRRIYAGTCYVFTPHRADPADPEAIKFGFSWIGREIMRHRWSVIWTLVLSLVVTLLGLVSPLSFQIIIDEVLPAPAFDTASSATLQAVACALIAAAVMSNFLDWKRHHLINWIGAYVDGVLTSQLAEHLARLPLSYFEANPAGVTIARTRELETLRGFMTSTVLRLPLDVMFIAVYLAVLLLFSVTLTLWVLAGLIGYALISALATPYLYAQIETVFQAGARAQSYLVETVTGIASVKAMAAEPQVQDQIERRAGQLIHTTLDLNEFANKVSKLIAATHQLIAAAVLIVGSMLVQGAELEVGALVAFVMISGRIAEPVLHLAQAWPEFQRCRVAVARLKEIFDTPKERYHRPGANVPEAINGRIELKDVRFSYLPNQARPTLDINLTIPPGQCLGIVGSSGSGKSTLAKLIQGFYAPSHGQVLIDGRDVAGLPVGWLRSQIGTVLQRSDLFRDTIANNITFRRGAFAADAIIDAAKLAGAHDFICELSGDYSAMLEERGANLSGGQQQRLAIARALITDPRILTLDEATSALDAESEEAIRQNLRKITAGRTTIIIAHRLAAVRDCDRIIVIEHGRIVEHGTHNSLLGDNGRYAALWRRQTDPVSDSEQQSDIMPKDTP